MTFHAKSTATLLQSPPGKSESVEEASPPSPYSILAKQTESKMEQIGIAQSIPYRDDFQSYLSKNGRFSIRSRAWRISIDDRPRCDVRMVFISGSTTNIINTWAFPYHATHNPVYAAELIALGGKPRLTFMDIQVPAMIEERKSGIASATSTIREAYPELRISEQPPEWAVDATAGEYLFARQMDEAHFERISRAYLDLFDRFIELIQSNAEVPSQFTAIEALTEYQLHHMEHSPGKTFLGKVFGDQWTDEFLREFLFCAPGEVA